MIPKTIWQTFATDLADLPATVARSVHLWASMNPEYNHRYFSDIGVRAYVENSSYPCVKDAFQRAHSGGAKADIWRALVLYEKGGVYADIDALPVNPLRTFVMEDDDAVTGIGHDEHGPEQFVMIYGQGHPVIKEYLQRVIEQVVFTGASSAIRSTGPTALYLSAVRTLCNFGLGSTLDSGRSYSTCDGRHWLRVLPTRHACPAFSYCGTMNSVGGNVKFINHASYRRSLRKMNITYHTEGHFTQPSKRIPGCLKRGL